MLGQLVLQGTRPSSKMHCSSFCKTISAPTKGLHAPHVPIERPTDTSLASSKVAWDLCPPTASPSIMLQADHALL